MTTTAADQGFTAYGAKLLTTAAPYDPRTRIGDRDDESYYVSRPGSDFLRPWLAIENDAAFQWPLGLDGFTLHTAPDLGTHHFVGDNKVWVDVIHTGAESISMQGNLPGSSAPQLVSSLREVVRRVAPNGKILFIPEIMSHAQRVQVSDFSTSRDKGSRGRTMDYSIDFWIIGLAGANNIPTITSSSSTATSTASPKGTSSRQVSADAAHNTLRKIAAWKLGSSNNWRAVYNLNEKWFVGRNIAISAAPDYRLPVGTVIYF